MSKHNGVGADLPRQRKVKMPVNFRPTERRFALIDAIQVKLGLRNKTEAIEAAIDIAAKSMRLG